MVLDSKAFEWASKQGLDTATLKKAKIPIYGKWYFPDLPANTPLVNLQTGEVETFGPGFRAGAILYVKEEDLKRAQLGPYKPAPPPEPPAAPSGGVGAGAGAESAAAGEPAEPEMVEASAAAQTAPAATAVATRPVAPPEEGHRGRPAEALGGHGEVVAQMHGAVAVAEHPHPTAQVYVTIAAILAVITALEVAVYYVEFLQASKVLLVGILLVLSAAKFSLVVGYFMHLKFDHKVYLGFFAGGLGIALSIVVALILLFITFNPIPTPALPGMPAPDGERGAATQTH